MNIWDLLFPARDWLQEEGERYLPTRLSHVYSLHTKTIQVAQTKDVCFYVFSYKDREIKDSLKKIKRGLEFDRIKDYSSVLKKSLAILQAKGVVYDAIIPVSDSYTRLSQRGFSFMRIALQTLPQHNIYYLFEPLVASPEYAQLSRTERLQNRLPIHFNKNMRTHISSWKRILLIDDVVTTGSTLIQHAHYLKKWNKKLMCSYFALCG